MFYRAFRLTSTYEAFHNEIMYLKQFFTNNGFPECIFYGKLRKFLNNIYLTKPKVFGPKRQDLYVKIPFLDDITNKSFQLEVRRILSRYYPQIDVKIIFFNNFKLKSFVNHKEKLPPAHTSMIVYCFCCPCCQLEYIGSSKRNLFQRYYDHKGASCRTNQPLRSPMSSSIRQHCEDSCGSSFSLENFKIIHKGNSELDIRIAESLLIKKRKPQLNQDASSFPLNL